MSNVARDRVADELALRNLVARYADAVTRMEASALRDLFTPRGEWIVTGHGEPRGHDEIVAFLEGLLAKWSGIVHALLSPTFDLRGLIPAHFGTRRSDRSMEESREEVDLL